MGASTGVQRCPACGGTIIAAADTLPLGDPQYAQSAFGWKCLVCGHTGKDFFIVEKRKGEKVSR